MNDKKLVLVIEKSKTISKIISDSFSSEFLVDATDSDSQILNKKYSFIFLVWSKEFSQKTLGRIIQKGKSINAEFVLVKKIDKKEDAIVKQVFLLSSTARAVLFGELFGKICDDNSDYESRACFFINQARSSGKISLPDDGLRGMHPIPEEDLGERLKEIALGLHKKNSLFYVFPKSVTELSFAHAIQKANPDIKIDFTKSSKKEELSFPENGKYLTDENYSLDEKIKKIDFQKKVLLRKSKKTFFKKTKLALLAAFLTIIFLVISPFVSALLFSALGIGVLNYAREDIEKGSLQNLKSTVRLSNNFFRIAKKSSEIMIFRKDLFLENAELGERASFALYKGVQSAEYFEKIFKGEANNPMDDFANAKTNLKSAIITIKTLQAEKELPSEINKKLKSIDSLLELVSDSVDSLDGLLGMDREKKYLVLLQNNMELRPGGGFIGSYGILRIKMGKIEEFAVFDVYDADGQLKGHVEPPFAVRRHLPSVHWYLRDSNFNISFSNSANEAMNFLTASTGIEADGVIAVDVSFVRNILKETGEVNVIDYNEIVNQNNLYEITQEYAEKDFFPGSTKKKDFLRSLHKAINTKIAGENISYFNLAKAISDSLLEKHLLIALNSKKADVFLSNKWASSLIDEREEAEDMVNDFFAFFEANLGVNKANYFISRDVFLRTNIENNKVIHDAKVIIKNQGTKWPGGDYKNYIRFALPLNTELEKVFIDGEEQELVDAIIDPLIYEEESFEKPEGLEIEKYIQDKKAIFGFLANVPSKKNLEINVKYNFPVNVVELNNFNYSLRIFKQPGIDSFPYFLSLSYPDSFEAVKISEDLKKENKRINYSGEIRNDKDLNVNFVKLN